MSPNEWPSEVKAQKGHKDADACLTAPLVLGVADGVSQIEVRKSGFSGGFWYRNVLQCIREPLMKHTFVLGLPLFCMVFRRCEMSRV